MKRKEILNALKNENFDDVYFAILDVYGVDELENYFVLPNISKVYEMARDFQFSEIVRGEKWLIVKMSNDVQKNFDFYDVLEANELVPYFGNYYRYRDFINK